jgi:hypothetical protein
MPERTLAQQQHMLSQQAVIRIRRLMKHTLTELLSGCKNFLSAVEDLTNIG